MWRKTNIDLLNDYLENLIDSYLIYLHPIKIHLFGHELTFNDFQNWWKQWDWPVVRRISFCPFWKIGFNFATRQEFGKTPCEIERLQSAEMGFANMLAPSFKNLPENSSTPAALGLSIVVFIFKFFFFRSITQAKIIWNRKTRIVSNYW